MTLRTQQRAVVAAIAAAGIAVVFLWWTWGEAPPDTMAGLVDDSSEQRLGSLGARLRLASRLARSDRLEEAREEAAAALAAAPGLSVRRWVKETYAGVKRQEDMEYEILLLTSLGLPEYGPVKSE